MTDRIPSDLAHHWQVLWQEADPASRHRLQAELAKLLLQRIRTDLDLYRDPERVDDLTDLLLEWQQGGDQIRQSLGQTLPHLDPELGDFEGQLTRLRDDLQRAGEQVEQATAKARQLAEANRALLDREAELRQAQSRLQALEAKVGELQALEDSLSEDNLQRLLDQAGGGLRSVGRTLAATLDRYLEQFEGIRREYAEHFQADSGVLTALRAQLERIGQAGTLEQVQDIEQRLREELTRFDRALAELIGRQQGLVEERQRLQDPAAR